MTYHNPTMLPKVRSKALMKAMEDYSCTLRISSMIPGHGCSHDETVVGSHINTPGKGMSTKSTDLAVAASCMNCHRLVERVDPRIEYLEEHYPAAVMHRLLMGLIETHALLARDGIIVVKGGTLL